MVAGRAAVVRALDGAAIGSRRKRRPVAVAIAAVIGAIPRAMAAVGNGVARAFTAAVVRAACDPIMHRGGPCQAVAAAISCVPDTQAARHWLAELNNFGFAGACTDARSRVGICASFEVGDTGVRLTGLYCGHLQEGAVQIQGLRLLRFRGYCWN